MTLFAERPDERRPETIKVSMTYGPITAGVEEDQGHIAYFWHQLGQLLGDAKHAVTGTPEHRARAGYERYRQHAGGVSKFSGDRLPAFDDQDDETRSHWIAAFTEE